MISLKSYVNKARRDVMHWGKRRIKQFRSGSFSLARLGQGSRPVGIAADERDFLFIAWDDGTVQAYLASNGEQVFSKTIEAVAPFEVLDICAYQEGESSGCYVLLESQSQPLLYKMDNKMDKTGKVVVGRDDDLPTEVCHIACYKSKLYRHSKKSPSITCYCFSFNDGPDESIDDCKRAYGIAVGRDHLFVIGQSKEGSHCLWIRPRAVEGNWHCYADSWRKKIWITRKPGERWLYVRTHEPDEPPALGVLYLSPPQTVPLYPKKGSFSGSAIAANLDCLFILDSHDLEVSWYGHRWIGLNCRNDLKG